MKIKIDTNDITEIGSANEKCSAITLGNGAEIYVSCKDNTISIEDEELLIE